MESKKIYLSLILMWTHSVHLENMTLPPGGWDKQNSKMVQY